MSLPGGSADGPASCPLIASAVIAAGSRWTGDPSPREELSPGLPVIAAPEGGVKPDDGSVNLALEPDKPRAAAALSLGATGLLDRAEPRTDPPAPASELTSATKPRS